MRKRPGFTRAKPGSAPWKRKRRCSKRLLIELGGDHSAARARYEACGSVGDVRRLGEELSGGGGRANAELTRRETQVAALIADGLSNRAIAERLVLSERTVEHHASAIFSKLAFRSRAQLAAFMSRPQPSA